MSTVRGDAQGATSLHEHPWRLTAALRTPSGEIRNMHSTYGYYGLYIYLRKEIRFFGVVGGKRPLREGKAALTRRTPACGRKAA